MHFLVKFLLRAMIDWIGAHPDSPFSRFMLKQRGPRTDVETMTRLERLTSALAFFFWGIFFALLWAGFAYLAIGLHLMDEENPAIMVVLAGLSIFAGIGLIGGLYLLLRVIV